MDSDWLLMFFFVKKIVLEVISTILFGWPIILTFMWTCSFIVSIIAIVLGVKGPL